MSRHGVLARVAATLFLLVLQGCGQEDAPGEIASLLDAPGEPFRQAEPGMSISLPADMGAHPEFRLEWWYLTANLHAGDGESFGVQWTLFRLGLKPHQGPQPEPGWRRDEFWLAHAALSRPDRHLFASKQARGGSGQAGVSIEPFRAWIDQWRMEARAAESYLLDVQAPTFAYRLILSPRLPPVLHGEQGFSAKSAQGGGSMYFSYPAIDIEGEIEVDGEPVSVTGQGWFDREWSSQYLRPGQQGWDWLALHLDDGRHLMLFRIRGDPDYFTGTLVDADGDSRTLDADDFTLRPLAYRSTEQGRVPVSWEFKLPAQQLALEIRSWPGEYWNPGRLGYWEGPVSVQGSVQGKGYLEMTGYSKR
ncbi:iron ABC transporter permease [Marinobacterium zhoushanense]|uniref:Iron ABC transporter permease n=1 Tax=Marinobacterium zhoushanense TaxID=1679163 RepID=A0ABQ1K2Y7_9GAMM|nr:lipocalin-like domain-containing protein [Marinobacterium zhoushanense]GGB83372.1 iron ABC transporter permease [Marinobacterium zhoushanense]